MLRPNNWYINRAKLQRVREAWRNGRQHALPPVLVSKIDRRLALIDGHSRAYAAYENGREEIEADLVRLEDIEGSSALYRYIHRHGPDLGVLTIADLADRIVSPEEHQALWIDWCTEWLAGAGATDGYAEGDEADWEARRGWDRERTDSGHDGQ
jgi:hypothetical protein